MGLALTSCDRYAFRTEDEGGGAGGGHGMVEGGADPWGDLRGVESPLGWGGDRGRSRRVVGHPNTMEANGEGIGAGPLGMIVRDGSGDSNDGPEDDPRWLAAHGLALAGDLAQLPPGLHDACRDRLDDARAVAQDCARANGLRTLAAVGVPRA